MKIEIIFTNPHFPWRCTKTERMEIFYKGDIYYRGKLLNDEEISEYCSYLIDQSNNGINTNIISQLSGCFGLVFSSDDMVIAITDRLRTVPVFYSEMENEVIISDSVQYLADKSSAELDEISALNFLLTGFTPGNSTFFKGVKQICAGECLHIQIDKSNNGVFLNKYHHFIHNKFLCGSEKSIIELIDKAFIAAFSRIIDTTAERNQQIFVPLSGGLDSRIVAAMLRRLDREDVVCFSYGNINNREHKISKKIANALGYQWYFVEYTPEKWEDSIKSAEIQKFRTYCLDMSSAPDLQEFIAIRELKNLNIIPENAVIIPGHSGCMLSGAHIPSGITKKQEYNLENIKEAIFNKYYNSNDWQMDELTSLSIKNRIHETIRHIPVYDAESYANTFEYFEFMERQSKLIVHSLRLYEYFNFKWQIPEWDYEIMDLFLHLPLENRINQKIYKKYASDFLFRDIFPKINCIECTTRFNPKQSIINDIKRFLPFCFTFLITGNTKFPWYMDLEKNLVKEIEKLPAANYEKYPALSRFIQENRSAFLKSNALNLVNYKCLNDFVYWPSKLEEDDQNLKSK